MIRTFIEVPLFTKRWKEIGLNDEDLLHLQIMLLKDPQSGPIMEGTGGIRKVRFPIENRGKSGSVRVCYADFEEYEVTYLKCTPCQVHFEIGVDLYSEGHMLHFFV